MEQNKKKVQDIKENKVLKLIKSDDDLNVENTKFIGSDEEIKWVCAIKMRVI